VGHKVNGKETDEVPAQASGYDKIECIYRKMRMGYANAGDSDGRSVAEGCPRISGIHRKRNRSAGGNDFDGSGSRADDFGARIYHALGLKSS